MEYLLIMNESVISTPSKEHYFGTVRQYIIEAQGFLMANEKACCDAKLTKLLDYLDNLEDAMLKLALLQFCTISKN